MSDPRKGRRQLATLAVVAVTVALASGACSSDKFRYVAHSSTKTYLKVQESGYLVKNPSILIKKVAFLRTYEIRDGISVPKQVLSIVDTRLVGKAQLTIDFTNVAIDPSKRAVAAEADDQ